LVEHALVQEVAVDELYRQPGSLFAVRTRARDGTAEAGQLHAAIPVCSLLDASLQLEVALVTHTAATDRDFRSLQLRPRVHAAYAGCKADAVYAAIPLEKRAKRLVLSTVVTVPVDVAPLPAVLTAKGTAFPGQQEVSEQEAVLAGGNLDPLQRAALQEEVQVQAAKKAEEEKGFLQKYWHFLLPLGIIFLMRGAGGGGAEEGAAGSAGAAGAAGGARGGSGTAARR
jgi:hypothetical protein